MYNSVPMYLLDLQNNRQSFNMLPQHPSVANKQHPQDLTILSDRKLIAPALFLDDAEIDDVEYIAIDDNNNIDWIEAQLLECQIMVRQQGLTRVADLIDDALDVLAESNVRSSPVVADS